MRRILTYAPTDKPLFAAEQDATKKSPGAQNHSTGIERGAVGQLDPRHASTGKLQCSYLACNE
jgi:hypothetical protein